MGLIQIDHATQHGPPLRADGKKQTVGEQRPKSLTGF
jgi:hypothetical protein